MKHLVHSLALAVLLQSSAVHAEDISSFVFSKNIGSNGSGSIDLFSPKTKTRTITGTTLEAFRQDNNGQLVFAVDVNEASSGSETANSQGLAIASATLTITLAGQTVVYEQFSTPTRSLLAEDGSTDRQEYFTLIGTAGTNRVSPNAGSEITGSSMDETLYFTVDRDISGATAATLDVTLLVTNIGLGDPEAFYDFSNGFEEVALLTKVDVDYLNSLAPGRELAPLVITDEGTPTSLNWVHYPSAESHFIASYEDLYPTKGDYDFNDLVVAYQVAVGTDGTGQVQAIKGSGYLIARGAAYDHDWHLRIGLPAGSSGSSSVSVFAPGAHTPLAGYPKTGVVHGSMDLILAERVATLFSDGESTYVNTFAEQNLVQGPRFEFEVTLDTPLNPGQVDAAPFDPYLYVHDTGYEVHLVDKAPVLAYSLNSGDGAGTFRDEAGYPFALVTVEDWKPPLAGVDMGLAYPKLIDHILSEGSSEQQWYLTPAADKIKAVPVSVWKW